MVYKKQIILISLAVVFTIGLSLLPKAVIKSKEDKTADVSFTASNQNNHDQILLKETNPKIDSLYSLFKLEKNSKNSIIFANQLATVYLEALKYDSAAHYFDFIATSKQVPAEISRDDARLNAADAYFKAFTFAINKDKKLLMASKAKAYFNALLEDAEALGIDKSTRVNYRVYITLIELEETPSPMASILKLRALGEEHPTNVLAQLELGKLSIQSGQWKKAIARFENVLKLEEEHQEGNFYLGMTLFEDNRANDARKYFEWTVNHANDHHMVNAAKKYLEK